MLRVVKCTLHRHCHHCHCHYQKCRCQIHLLRCLRRQSSSESIPSCNVYFATSDENRCRRHACGGGDGGGGGGVWWLLGRRRETVTYWKRLSENATGRQLRIFLKNNLNKADLIRRLNELVKREVPRLHLDYSLVITLEKEAWGISLTGVQNLSPCNHEEADIRIMYYYTLEDKPTVVIASDTDILIIVVHVFASGLPDHDWFLQTRKNQFVNVSKVHDYIGNAVAMTLPAMFVLAGCDTVSYFYVSPRSLYLSLEARSLAVELLSDFGEHTYLSDTSEKRLKRFFQIFV